MCDLRIVGLALMTLAGSAAGYQAVAQHNGKLMQRSGEPEEKVKTLTLEETVSLGLQNSKQVKIAASQARETAAALKETRQRRLPDFDVSGQYMRLLNSANVNLQAGSGSGDAPPDQNGSDESSGGPSSPDYLILGQASLSVPLFAGFRLSHAVRSAEYLEKAAKLNAEANENEMTLNLVRAWANLFKAGAAVELMEENLKQAHQRTTDFSHLEENGLLARNDLLKARLRESTVELALLEARNNLEITAYNMNLLLGLPENTICRADTSLRSGDPPLSETELSLGRLEENALADRKDLSSAALNAQAATEEVNIAAGERWPSIGLSAGYIAADLHNVLSVTNAVNIGLGVSFNLASLYKSNSRVEQAKEKAAQSKLVRDQLADKVRIQVHRAFSDYQLSLKKIAVHREAVEQASENFRITRNKHINSLATTTDLLDADIAQLKTRLDVRYAEADALVARYTLLKAAGQLAP